MNSKPKSAGFGIALGAALGAVFGVIAGHVEEGNEVFTFAIVTIGVMNGANFDKLDDKTYR